MKSNTGDGRELATRQHRKAKVVFLAPPYTLSFRADDILAVWVDGTTVHVDTRENKNYKAEFKTRKAARADFVRFVGDWNDAISS